MRRRLERFEAPLLRLAIIRLGRNVAASIYPDLQQLPDVSGAQTD
jgi:hypothetical protein